MAVLLASAYDYDVVDSGIYEGVNNFVFSFEDDDSDGADADNDNGSIVTMSSNDESNGSGPGTTLSKEDKLIQQATLMAKQAEKSIRRQQLKKHYVSSEREYVISVERHRKRRYSVASNLLWKVTDYLYLEGNNKLPEIQKLRPILEVLLLPPSKRKLAAKGAGGGPGGVLSSSSSSSPSSRRKSTATTAATTTKEATTSYSQSVRNALLQRMTSTLSSDEFSVDEDDESPRKRVGSRKRATPEPWSLQQDELITQVENNSELLQQKLQYMTPGAGYQCLILVLFQYLLNSEEGYDTRIRFVMKKLFVIFYIHNSKNPAGDGASSTAVDNKEQNTISYDDRIALATRKFENLEHVLADRILTLAKENHHRHSGNHDDLGGNYSQITRAKKATSRKQQLLNGLKIGTAGVVAGTLLVVTGGMAAPGIAAGLGALHLAAVGTTVLLLAGSHAAVSIFGVAGGSLAMYKMNRRNAGLSEFVFQQVLDDDAGDNQNNGNDGQSRSTTSESELSRTICVSGWLNDKHDFQRPWGVAPNDPPISDKLELLQRFYLIHNPELAPYSENILKCWKGSEMKLWQCEPS